MIRTETEIINAKENPSNDSKPQSRHDVYIVAKFLARKMSFATLKEIIYHNLDTRYTVPDDSAVPNKPKNGYVSLEKVKKALRADQPAPAIDFTPKELPSMPTLLDAMTRLLGDLLETSFEFFSLKTSKSESNLLGHLKNSTNPLCKIRTSVGPAGEVYVAVVTLSTTLRSSRGSFCKLSQCVDAIIHCE